MDPKTGKYVLQEEDYEKASKILGVEKEALMAVAQVESAGHGFQIQEDGTIAPLILFEAHVFSRLTNHKYDKTHPNISKPFWDQKSYGPSIKQHSRLQMAAKLDREAALKSASWGKFQLMGFEYKQNGYNTLQEFINDMYDSELGHLRGFIGFLKSKTQLIPALKSKNWATFALYYNGTGYKRNNYDLKMANEYNKLKNKKV